jgi:hypothetical protein
VGLIESVGQFIEDEGLGVQGTDLFIGDMPQNAPEIATAVVETSGTTPAFAHDIDGVNYEQPTFQVYTRAEVYSVARSLAESIWVALNKQVNVTLSGSFFMRIAAQQSPFSLGRDDNHRAQIVCNYSARKGLTP